MLCLLSHVLLSSGTEFCLPEISQSLRKSSWASLEFVYLRENQSGKTTGRSFKEVVTPCPLGHIWVTQLFQSLELYLPNLERQTQELINKNFIHDYY